MPALLLVQLGGTVGDIESMPFIEAFRQFQFAVHKENFLLIYVSLVRTSCFVLWTRCPTS